MTPPRSLELLEERLRLRDALELLLAVAEQRIPEAGQGYDYADLAEGEPLKYGIVSAKFVADTCREALGREQ